MIDSIQQYPNPTADSGVRPICGDRGASILGPRNIALEAQIPDLLCSPYTDAGTIPNLKPQFSNARNRRATGSWAREATVRELPASIRRAEILSTMSVSVIC